MPNVVKNIEVELKDALEGASEVWTAVAMMNSGGLKHFKNLSPDVVQHHLVGIDLPTPTRTLEELRDLCSDNFSAKVREAEKNYNFHPKTYIIKDQEGFYVAFVGSSNATNGGLQNNIELNIKITDQDVCQELVGWYWEVDEDAVLITQELIDQYKKRYKAIKQLKKKQKKETDSIKSVLHRSDGQFFSAEHHEIFKKEYQKENSDELKKVRGSVRKRLINLHKRIYPEFSLYGLSQLYENSKDRTSRHYINAFSGKAIASLWLHYGKSPTQMAKYAEDEENKSFINHVRMQVIIHADDVGIWLVLGKDGGSEIDRSAFRERMADRVIKNNLLKFIQNLDSEYWITSTLPKPTKVSDVNNTHDLDKILKSEKTWEYFIIGRTYSQLDPSISNKSIDRTVLREFKKLYPIYELMNAEIV